MTWLKLALALAVGRSLRLRRFLRDRRRRSEALFLQREWRELLRRSGGAPPRASRRESGLRVLFATSVGGRTLATRLESLLGTALKLRGADVSVLLCDAALPACVQCTAAWYPNQTEFLTNGPSQDMCRSCCGPAATTYETLGFTVYRFSEFVNAADRDAIRAAVASVPGHAIASYRYAGAAVGEQAMAGTLRFFARATLEQEPDGERILKQFLAAAMITAIVVQRLLESRNFDCVVADHGIYVPQGVVGDMCRLHGTRVVHWQPAYRKGCFIFSHSDTYHRTLLTEPTSAWENVTLSPQASAELTGYLMSRRFGTKDWIKFTRAPETQLESITRALGIDWTRPSIGLLTNVMWDAQVDYESRAFPNMLAWLVQTVDFFARRPNMQLIVRVHPAELYGVVPSRQWAADEIRAAFPALPSNVFLIGPESPISTYAVMERCNTVLIYATTTGIELATTGIPIVVAGEAWVRNKGITIDISSPEEYSRVLERLPLRRDSDGARTERARRYAYHFYFRRMIPLEAVRPSDEHGPFVLNLQDLSELAPGRSVGLDVICDGIVQGTPFVYPAELQGLTASAPMPDTGFAQTARA